MKPISSHPLRFIAAGDWQYFSHTRQVMVKSSVETSHLRQVRKSAMKRLNQAESPPAYVQDRKTRGCAAPQSFLQ